MSADQSSLDAFVPTRRTTLRRHKERGNSDRTLVYADLDEAEDLTMAVWAGHVPIQSTRGIPVADEGVDVDLPSYLTM